MTLVPALMMLFVRGRILPERRNPVNRALIWLYRPLIRLVLRARLLTIAVAVAALAASAWPAMRLGAEFMPSLDEGTLFYMPVTLPGLSVTKSAELLQTQNKIIKSFPEVASVFGKAGRAATATDPAPLEMFETIINLKPKADWRPGMTVDKLIAEMDRALQFPGVSNAWTMPIKARIDMLATGIRTPVGVKLLGRDYAELEPIARQVEAAIHSVPGTTSAHAERVTGGYFLDIVPDRARLAQYGVMIEDVQQAVASALGGEAVTTTVEGRERYSVNVRYARDFRSDPRAIASDVLVSTMRGGMLPLGQLAEVRLTQGPTTIRTENAQLAVYVYVDFRDRDLAGFVADARRAVQEKVVFPAGTYAVWSGQFEYLERAEAKLKLVVPATLLLIFVLLYLNFGRLTETLIVMLSLPFALVGGLWLVWWMGFNMSVAVAVGFIALAGVAAETGVVMLIYLDQALRSAARALRGGRPRVHARRPSHRDHGRRGRTRTAEDDDRDRHRCRAAADPVERGHRLGGDAAHRRADGGRHGEFDAADFAGNPRDLCPGKRLEPAIRAPSSQRAEPTRRLIAGPSSGQRRCGTALLGSSNDETGETAHEAQHAAGGQGDEIGSGPVDAGRERKGPERSAANTKHKRRASDRAEMITAKVLSVAGSANGLLRPIGAAQAQSVKPADGNATAECGQSRRCRQQEHRQRHQPARLIAIQQGPRTECDHHLNARIDRQNVQRVRPPDSRRLHDREVVEQKRRTDGVGQEADSAEKPEDARPQCLLAGERGFLPCFGRDRPEPRVRREAELFRSVTEQRGGDGKNGQSDEQGQCEIGAPPTVQRDQRIDQLRKDHGPHRKSETGCGRCDPPAVHEP